MIKLTPRLLCVAQAVGNCNCFLDIGTDHAYLPAYLIENGIAKRAIASDINPNPLLNAERTVADENLTGKIELRLSDGFKNIKPDEAEEIAVAGMGGLMIAEMLNTTAWLKNSKYRLVLQPMTHFEDVRRALNENGFEITDEQTALEGKRVYLVISARYSGITEEKPVYWYYTGMLAGSKKESDIAFCNKVIKALTKKYEGSGDMTSLEALRSIENAKGN